jgi:hypothetical protein
MAPSNLIVAKKISYVPGINIQWPWSTFIARGEKTIETRSYDIPEKHRGRPLALIETPGPNGKREAQIHEARIIALVTFKETYPYLSRQHWLSEQERHKVTTNDLHFQFKPQSPKWAWVVQHVELLPKELPPPARRGIVFAVKCQIIV